MKCLIQSGKSQKCYTKPLSSIIIQRINKISLFVLDNPGCSRSDIYKKSGATKNHDDFKKDIKYLISTGDLLLTDSAEKFFKEPIKKEFLEIYYLHTIIDNIKNYLKENPNLSDYDIAKQIKYLNLNPKKLNYKIIIGAYYHEYNPARLDSDQLVSKLIIILIQKSRIYHVEYRKFIKNIQDFKTRTNDFYKFKFDLPERIQSIQSLDGCYEILLETAHNRMIYDYHNKEYRQLCKRSDISQSDLVSFLEYSTEIISKACVNPKNSSPSTTDDIRDIVVYLDQIYDDDHEYLLSLRSAHRRSLKKLVKIQTCIYQNYDKDKLASINDYKNRRTMTKSVQKILKHDGSPDMNKIKRLQRVECNRIFVEKIGDDEIHVLSFNFKKFKKSNEIHILNNN